MVSNFISYIWKSAATGVFLSLSFGLASTIGWSLFLETYAATSSVGKTRNAGPGFTSMA